ncbi:MAG: hypothetical protein H6657_07725 [Ardenticatenaceae bacterium]|nr:hypothetical protein [Ardenticatenaceae bacterium]
MRVETAPGEEAQVDFGYAGRMMDPATGEIRKAWAFCHDALLESAPVCRIRF